MNTQTQVVLVTGASSGIGLEVARQLMEKGVCVYAGSRRGGEPLKSDHGSKGEIIPVKMDINKTEDLQAVLIRIIQEKKKLDAVICNAGNGVAGAVEDTYEEELRYQMETNFFGTVKTVQACLPVFRKQRYGKIMVTSSIASLVPIPYQAFYSAGKSAIYIFLQALAMEVKPFGIQCCNVLPGDTKTGFTSARRFTEKSQSAESPYARRLKKSVSKMEKDEQNGMSASFVARKMVRQIMRRHMKPVVVPGLLYKLICFVLRIVPNRLKLFILRIMY